MSRGRARGQDLGFGSDSFLDIVANMVGILIILIVIVGVRVRHAPSSAEQAAAKSLAEETEKRNEVAKRHQQRIAEIEAENERRRTEHAHQLDERLERKRINAEREAEQRRIEAERREQLRERRLAEEELEREAIELRRQIAELMGRTEPLRQAVDQDRSNTQALAVLLASRESEHAAVRAQLTSQRHELEQLHGSADSVREELDRLKEEMEKLKAEANGPVQPWKHFGTPVASRVREPEIDFQCRGGRIAYTYLPELMDRLMLESRKGLQRAGSVGPLGGFRLRYFLAGPSFLATNALERVELDPESELLGETAADALRAGSAFHRALSGKPPSKYVVTLWVYPDSFAVAKSVEMFLHQRGYRVAQRPLPHDVPISGSPSGSASQAQ